MTRPIRIERWACKAVDPYRPPEAGYNLQLRGDLYGHPRFQDGERVTTSAVVGVEGRVVRTENGSIYELGEPDPRYLAWLEMTGIPFDPAVPIRVKGGAS